MTGNRPGIAQEYGFRLPQTGEAGTADEAAQIAQDIGFPVALKVVSPDVPHKTDVGGVELKWEPHFGITNP